ncbi:MAG: dTDP-4-amino-4,6-dideoxygalactose transaminase [Pseudomonadota bacterium]
MAISSNIPFNSPYLTGDEQSAINEALSAGKIHGDGEFTQKCQRWFTERLGASSAHLTGSCTSGLDMASLVAGFGPGDEVLVPDFTFVSSAQCVALRDATPVLCDIRDDTLNMDETRLEEALTDKTKAIIPVHYAGVSAEMNSIREFADKHNLLIIEDAAQAIGCSYHEKPVGMVGDMSVFSFHSTKNVHCGEGGMVVVNNPEFSEKCSIAWEKGTDRSRFMEGRVEKYQWQALGSSFLASEITAAMLSVQLNAEQEINDRRRVIWQRYNDALGQYSGSGKIKTPYIPDGVVHNGHMYFIILPDQNSRSALISELEEKNISAVFHYTPLHESNGGKKYCKQGMELRNASDLPHRLLRLPLYPDLSHDDQSRVIDMVFEFVERL